MTDDARPAQECFQYIQCPHLLASDLICRAGGGTMKYGIWSPGQPVRTSNIEEFTNWPLADDRRVAFDRIGDVDVSTVFLVFDHSWGGKPLWFETMVFGGHLDQEQWRYETEDEARAGHQAVVEMVKAGVL